MTAYNAFWMDSSLDRGTALDSPCYVERGGQRLPAPSVERSSSGWLGPAWTIPDEAWSNTFLAR